MRVDLLIKDLDAVVAFSRAMRSPLEGPLPIELKYLSSWQAVIRRAQDGAGDVTVVQADFPPDDSARGTWMLRLKQLTSVVPAGGVVPYVCRSDSSGSVLCAIRHVGFPFLIVQGVDDDAHSLLRILARGRGLREINRRLRSAGNDRPDQSFHMVLSALLGWPAAHSVSELAHRLHVSDRTLQRRLRDRGLPSPGRMIHWARVIEAEALCRMGLRSRMKLASVLGLRDPRSLPRLYQECMGEPLGERLRAAEKGRSEAVSAFLSAISG